MIVFLSNLTESPPLLFLATRIRVSDQAKSERSIWSDSIDFCRVGYDAYPIPQRGYIYPAKGNTLGRENLIIPILGVLPQADTYSPFGAWWCWNFVGQFPVIAFFPA
ncbi:MAG: hypothetical protein D3922_07515 [Candidatus Electrothrix sp. AR1]|nr:hypothetical protein [Candidatus Electrothrix sp. AR1]